MHVFGGGLAMGEVSVVCFFVENVAKIMSKIMRLQEGFQLCVKGNIISKAFWENPKYRSF